MNEPVEVVVFLISAVRRGFLSDPTWRINARVIQVAAKVQAEYALVSVPLSFEYHGSLLPKMSLKPGLLFRVGIPVPEAEKKLDAIANGEDPFTGPPIEFTVERLQPMAEPCARVPVSLLRELRGQHGLTEMAREALVRCWTSDRVTGKGEET